MPGFRVLKTFRHLDLPSCQKRRPYKRLSGSRLFLDLELPGRFGVTEEAAEMARAQASNGRRLNNTQRHRLLTARTLNDRRA